MENTFLTALQSRHENAFEELYQRYGNRLYCLASSILADRTEAEDAVQETLLKVYDNIHSFKGESDLFTWMYAIVKNHCLRTRKQQLRLSFTDMESLLDAASTESAWPRISEEERSRCIEQVREGCLLGLLRCLNLQQRTAFVLHILLEIPVKDTAAVLGKTENATRILVSRARSGLHRFLCQNCSLYQPGNRCACENLVAFSLRQGWIDKTRPGKPVDVETIAKEIDDLKRLVMMYRSLPRPRDLRPILQKALAQKGLSLTTKKKVK